MVNVACRLPAGMETVAGTLATAVSLDTASETFSEAGRFNWTVATDDMPPATVPLDRNTMLMSAAAKTVMKAIRLVPNGPAAVTLTLTFAACAVVVTVKLAE